MTKRDLVVKIAKETGFVQPDVAVIVQKMLDCIASSLAAGKGIEIRNFGTFEIKVRKSRPARNPKKPWSTVIIPEHPVAKFRAGKELKNGVAKLNAAKIK